MGQKVIRKDAKELAEEKELEEFIASKQEKSKNLVKNIFIIIVCLALVVAFCLPGVLSAIVANGS